MDFRKIIVLIGFILSLSTAWAKDSLVYDLGEFKVYLNQNNSYSVKNNSGKILHKNLKYFGNAIRYWQVLDENNEMFYLNDKMKESKIEDNFLGLCGTVPHYTLKIKSNKNEFIVMEDETFYDYGNEIPAEEKFRISKKDADEVYFINGEKAFDYSGNYGFAGVVAQPDWVIYKKNGKYGICQDETKTMYDEIYFENSNLKLKKDGHFGFYGFTKIKYQDIQPFIFNLARIKTTDGKTGYVDVHGKEYLD